MPKKAEPSIEEQYKKLTQYEHILSRPDTYVGSLEFQKERLWVFNSQENKLEFREVSYVPGLFKIFDEILVNAADNYQRDKNMKYIKVDINPEENIIRIKNGGKGIPIEIHKTYNMYVPQLIFGNLLTSSNYNDNIKKVTGGRNGYGAKLTNIFSKTFIVETANQDKGKKYKQKFYNNMLKFDPPEIKDYSGDDFTSITFEPDLSRFGMEKMDEDIISLFKKRVYDMAGITPKGGNVYFKKNIQSTIGVDFATKLIEFRDNTIKLQIWDSAGQERYKALIPSYVRGAAIIFIIYDLSDKKSFMNLETWINFIKQVNTDDSLVILAGNKNDLERQVTYNEGYELAQKNNMMFFETSAKKPSNINLMMFSAIAELPFFSQFEIDKESLIKELQKVNCKNGSKVEEINNDLNVKGDNNDNTQTTKIIIQKRKKNCDC